MNGVAPNTGPPITGAPLGVNSAASTPAPSTEMQGLVSDFDAIMAAFDAVENGFTSEFIEVQTARYQTFNQKHIEYLTTSPSLSDSKTFNSSVPKYLDSVSRYFNASGDSSKSTAAETALKFAIQESVDLIKESIQKQQQQQQLQSDNQLALSLQASETALASYSTNVKAPRVTLPDNMEVLPTLGDGNCLFNGIALSLMTTIKSQSEDVSVLSGNLWTKITELASSDYNWNAFKTGVEQCQNQGADIQTTLQGPLRRISVAAVKSHMEKDSTFAEQVKVINRIDCDVAGDEYVKQLSKDGSWGSYLEAREIVDALDMDFHLYHPHGNDTDDSLKSNGVIRLHNRGGVHWSAVVPTGVNASASAQSYLGLC